MSFGRVGWKRLRILLASRHAFVVRGHGSLGWTLPFGQSRRFIENVGWPRTWAGYVGHVRTLSRAEFRQALDRYKAPRPQGDKEHLRATDRVAKSISPQKQYVVPVALMFFEGAPRLLATGVTIPHLNQGDPDRLVFEAYPGVLARSTIGKRSYKSDDKKRQTEALKEARLDLMRSLLAGAPAKFGFSIEAPDELCVDPSGDRLDALLCAIQAAWAWQQCDQGFGACLPIDSLEGWIADPSLSTEGRPAPKTR